MIVYERPNKVRKIRLEIKEVIYENSTNKKQPKKEKVVKSKSITIYDATVEEIHNIIMKVLKKDSQHGLPPLQGK